MKLFENIGNNVFKVNEIGQPDEITIERKCPMCQKTSNVTVKKQDIEKWKKGELIQRAFPYLDNDQREILKTGICPACWDKVMNDV